MAHRSASSALGRCSAALSLGLGLSLLLSSGRARGDDAFDLVVEPPPPEHSDTLRRFTQVELGFRTAFIKDPGFDAFSSNDAFNQMSVGASQTVFVDGSISVAVGARWDFGTSRSVSRGADTALTMHRLEVPLETRLHLSRILYVFGRLAPGAMHTAASVSDGSSTDTLTDGRWSFSADASLGAAFLLGPTSSPRSHLPRFWLTAEGGYGWTPARAVEASVDPGQDDFRQYGGIALRPLAMRGGFFRLGVSTTF
jgi:hypothetical protein